MTASWKWRRWRTWTLRRQLVLGVSGVVMVVLVVVAVLSVLTLRAQMTAMIDTHLAGSCDTFGHSLVKYRDGVGSSGNPAVPGPLKPLTEFTGQSPGNLIALIQNGRVVDSAQFTDGEPVRAPASAIREIEDQSWTDNVPRTIYLDGLGSYRMQSRTGEDGERLVSGVSLRQAHEAVAHETAIVAALAALAVVVTALSTIVIVRVALRPLARVAATAAEVATLPLDRENHEITPRVPDSDTDPCTEVGLVGDTMNKLLDHVESALGERAASDRRMRQFITDASHELRTPLAAIQGYAELTRQDSSVLPDTTEYSLARIEAEAQRMSALVSDLLLLARLDEGQDLQTEDVDLVDIVADAVNDAMVSAPGHGWLLDVEETSVWVARRPRSAPPTRHGNLHS
jgi:two-component system sensor histidine kinase TrcS